MAAGDSHPESPGFSIEARAAVAVLAILLIYWLVQRLFRSGSGSRGSSMLLVGPSGAGKTVLFLQLKEGDTLNGTVTSMDENEGTFRPKAEGADGIDSAVHFVDLPGHPRLKHKLEKYIGGAAGIVFMLDATDFMPHSKDIAEQLYDLLTHPVFRNHHIPLLLACNKADLGAKAHTDNFIVKLLEREIENLRSTQSTLEGEGRRTPIGKEGEAFSFKHVVSKVAVAKISAITGDIGPVLQFTRECVKL
ncbi:unnamed protein product [Ostreobium quekettii]|uniref:Signal recognition particle receptor subunit beta n=1 Tax=Ostreobium quekettii TaxID=121088 RepID=A0A8S1IYF2_9CHLO|nr:unnamed protein product [Ostreobium quekettii]|eukprot:evm.model.scf_497.3 EVM.evm.TU.scf_497.3   scf_497:43219-48288(+)